MKTLEWKMSPVHLNSFQVDLWGEHGLGQEGSSGSALWGPPAARPGSDPIGGIFASPPDSFSAAGFSLRAVPKSRGSLRRSHKEGSGVRFFHVRLTVRRGFGSPLFGRQADVSGVVCSSKAWPPPGRGNNFGFSRLGVEGRGRLVCLLGTAVAQSQLIAAGGDAGGLPAGPVPVLQDLPGAPLRYCPETSFQMMMVTGGDRGSRS